MIRAVRDEYGNHEERCNLCSAGLALDDSRGYKRCKACRALVTKRAQKLRRNKSYRLAQAALRRARYDREVNRRKLREMYYGNAAMGLCGRCSDSRAIGSVWCEKHRDVNRKASLDWYYRNRSKR